MCAFAERIRITVSENKVCISDVLRDLFGTAGAPFNPFYPRWIPVIQGAVLLAGLYFGISRGHAALKVIIDEPRKRARALVLPALFALLMVNVLLKLYMA